MNDQDDTPRDEPSGADRPATTQADRGAPPHAGAGYPPPAWPPSPQPWSAQSTNPAWYPGASASGEGYPGASGQGYPGASGQGYPGASGQGYPGASGQGYPAGASGEGRTEPSAAHPGVDPWSGQAAGRQGPDPWTAQAAAQPRPAPWSAEAARQQGQGVPPPAPWTATPEAPQYRPSSFERASYEPGPPISGNGQGQQQPAYGSAGVGGSGPGQQAPYGSTAVGGSGPGHQAAYGAAAGGAGSPPYDQGGNPPAWAETWGTPAPNRATRRHRARAVVAAGVTVGVLGAAAAGVAIGHAAWPVHGSTPSAAASGSGSTGLGSGSGSSGLGSGSGSSGLGSGSGSSGLGSGSGSSGSGSTGSGSSPFGSLGSAGSGGASTATGAPSNAAAIAAKVDPGLVDINTTLGYQGEEAAGTGMVLTSNGEILTNNHVIDGATSIRVTDIGNGKTYGATVVGYDRTQDVAVLQLTNASGLTTVTLGNSSSVVKGQPVVGIGNAGGTGGTPSYAGGQVTALGQTITASDQGGGNAERLVGLIQTNANIQPGDSGGALVNTSGQVIGMDTAASSSAQFQSVVPSTSYAIPINQAVSITKQIESGKSSALIHIGATPLLGVEVQSASQSTSGLGGSSSGSGTSGAVIAGVVAGSPAADAGLEQGDTITAVGGQAVTSATGLTTALGSYKPGNSVQVTYLDANGQSHTATVHLTAGPPQ